MITNKYITLIMACISLCFCNLSIAMEEDSVEASHEFKSNIVLKNGGRTNVMTLLNTDWSVKAIQRTNTLAIIELVQKCRNANSTFHEKSSPILQRYQLIDKNHEPHESIIDIMISMATGDGNDMVIGNPAAPLIKVK